MSQAHDLRDEAATLPTLEHAFRWALRQSPPLRPVDVVIQDEYTHDVLFAAADESVLVFDATWLGAINAVSVWDHQPTADELLDARLANGWTPTASELQTGNVILGHAACRVTLPAK